MMSDTECIDALSANIARGTDGSWCTSDTSWSSDKEESRVGNASERICISCIATSDPEDVGTQPGLDIAGNSDGCGCRTMPQSSGKAKDGGEDTLRAGDCKGGRDGDDGERGGIPGAPGGGVGGLG
jgi:hypothetical protein